VKIGTVSGYLRAYYYDYNTWPDDVSWPEIGIPLNSTESCEYNGGQSTIGGTSIVLSDDVSYENQSAVGSISASESGNSLNVSFSAFAISAPAMAPTGAVRGRGEVKLETDAEQIVLIVENLTTGQVDLRIDWAITEKILNISGNGSCEAYVAYDLNIGETNNSYYSKKHCNGSINSSGQPSGSQIISIGPGKHCLDLNVGVKAVTDAYWNDYNNTPTSSEASISGVVNISVQ
jgi:hypothetical protein